MIKGTIKGTDTICQGSSHWGKLIYRKELICIFMIETDNLIKSEYSKLKYIIDKQLHNGDLKRFQVIYNMFLSTIGNTC